MQSTDRYEAWRNDQLKRRGRGPAQDAPLQGFACQTCGDVFMAVPSLLPVHEDCNNECAISPVLLCKSRPLEEGHDLTNEVSEPDEDDEE